MRKAKETWIEEQCQGIEENLQKNNSKKTYQLVKELTSSKQERTTTIQDQAGKCLTEEQDILKRWTECCSEPLECLVRTEYVPVLCMMCAQIRMSHTYL